MKNAQPEGWAFIGSETDYFFSIGQVFMPSSI
jgi:hypothetical protein